MVDFQPVTTSNQQYTFKVKDSKQSGTQGVIDKGERFIDVAGKSDRRITNITYSTDKNGVQTAEVTYLSDGVHSETIKLDAQTTFELKQQDIESEENRLAPYDQDGHRDITQYTANRHPQLAKNPVGGNLSMDF